MTFLYPVRGSDEANLFQGKPSDPRTKQTCFKASRPTLGRSKLVLRQAVRPSDEANLFQGKPSDPRTKQTCFKASRPTLGRMKNHLI
ncbi:hypothetical protein [Streptococcus anginosus]|uniref:hypothetical protein n=1 Tax=Streptococcus anginosus TaxID=1328 RepID=UPI003CF31ACA